MSIGPWETGTTSGRFCACVCVCLFARLIVLFLLVVFQMAVSWGIRAMVFGGVAFILYICCVYTYIYIHTYRYIYTNTIHIYI